MAIGRGIRVAVMLGTLVLLGGSPAALADDPPVTHAGMHRMMDELHGPGAGRQMHQAMAQAMGLSPQQVERMMDACVEAMNGTMRGR